MRSSIARAIANSGAAVQYTDIPPPQSATLGLHPVVRKLLLISRPAEGRRLSWPEHTVRLAACSRLLASDPGEIRTCDVKVASPMLYH